MVQMKDQRRLDPRRSVRDTPPHTLRRSTAVAKIGVERLYFNGFANYQAPGFFCSLSRFAPTCEQLHDRAFCGVTGFFSKYMAQCMFGWLILFISKVRYRGGDRLLGLFPK